MGGNVSQLPPTPAGFPYFCVTFRQWDKLKLLHASNEQVSVVRDCVALHWPNGVQREANDMGAFEIKFNGSPFSKNTSKNEALAIKRFCCAVLGQLERQGWHICVSTDLSRTTDLTTWFFERGAVSEELLGPAYLCVSLSSHDKIQVVNAPTHVHTVVKEAAGASYGYGIQDDHLVGEDYELKLSGYPWYTASFEEGVYARRALLEIFRRLHTLHYTLKTTANLKGTADCIFFKQVEELPPASYMMLSLNASDRIRLIDAPDDVIAAVGECISAYWTQGMQDQTDYRQQFGCYEYKLSGYPWNSHGYSAVSSRLLITTILQSMVAKGWAVCHSLDISRRVNDKAVIVFRSCPPASLPHFCLSPNDLDKLRLINAPPDIIEITTATITANWPYGIQKYGANAGCFEYKVGGQPWSAYAGNDYAHARNLMCILLREYASRFFAYTAGSSTVAPSAPPQNMESPPPSYNDIVDT